MKTSPPCPILLPQTLNPILLHQILLPPILLHVILVHPIFVESSHQQWCHSASSNVYTKTLTNKVHNTKQPFEKDNCATWPPLTSNLKSNNYGITCLWRTWHEWHGICAKRHCIPIQGWWMVDTLSNLAGSVDAQGNWPIFKHAIFYFFIF